MRVVKTSVINHIKENTMTIKFNTKLHNKHAIFDTKEQYLNFRSQWKSFINAGGAKKVTIKYKHWLTGEEIKYKKSPLSAEYHMLYCLILGKDLSKIFKFKDVGVEEKYKFYVKRVLNCLTKWNDPNYHVVKYMGEESKNIISKIFIPHITPEVASRILEQIEKAPE
jgi:hypothetical protein